MGKDEIVLDFQICKSKKSLLQVMAVWMTMLIIMLPFYVSDVFAVEEGVINVLSIEGGDGIRNLRRSKEDFTKVEVEVFSSEPLTAENIQLKSTSPGSAPMAFQTCTDISPYICTWQSSTGDIPMGAYSLYSCIGLCDNCFKSSCKKRTTIYVDGVAPAVDLLEADRTTTNGGEIKLHYEITDSSCLSTRCFGYCSGIDKAELYDIDKDGIEELVATIDIDSEECNVEDHYNFSAEGMGNGVRRLCMLPYDKFGQSFDINTAGKNCIEIKKDDRLPSFLNVRIMDPTETYDMKYVSSSGTRANLIVNVSTSKMFNLIKRKLTANLISIGGSSKDSIPCIEWGNGYWTCTKRFDARAPGSGSQSIQISAVDMGGNNNTQTFTFSLEADSTKPVVDKITTNYELSEAPYLKPGLNKVFAIITETGSGLTNNNVYFGVGDVNRAVCGVTGDKWICYANITAKRQMLVSVHGEDDAGNTFAKARNMAIDKKKPSLDKVILLNTNNNPYFVKGDDMMVTAIISDNKELIGDSEEFRVYVIPDGFADPMPIKADSCEYDDEDYNAWVCKWTLMNVAPGKVKMEFNISDFVGNVLEKKITRYDIEYLEPATGNSSYLLNTLAEVFEVEGEEADYWTATAGVPMPATVDSATTEAVEHDVWIPVELSPRSGAAIFSVELAGCTGEHFGTYAKEAILVRSSPRSTVPYIRITLRQGPIDVTELNFECALNIVSKYRKKLSQVELENFTANVPVISHGEYSTQVLMEILRVSRGWLVKATWMTMIGNILNIFTNVCGLLASIGASMTAIAAYSVPVAHFCEKFPFCTPVAVQAKTQTVAAQGTTHAAGKYLYKFCQYASCSKTLWGSRLKIGDYPLFGDPDADAGTPERIGFLGNIEGKLNTQLGKGTGGLIGSQEGQQMSETERKERGLDPSGLLGQASLWGNPSESLVLSIATGCIPGIFMNLQKARQIECAYLSCLVNDVPGGMPLAACTKVRNFQWCMFVFGEIFSLIPINNIISGILGPVIQLLSNPFTLIFGLLGLACAELPDFSTSTTCMAMDIANAVLKVVSTIKEIMGAKDMFNLKGSDSCKDTLQRSNDILSKFLGNQYESTYGTGGTGGLSTSAS